MCFTSSGSDKIPFLKANCTPYLSLEEQEDDDVSDEDDRIGCLLADIIPEHLGELQSCKEDFPKHGRIIYSSVSMVIQYLLPTLTISIAYWQIYGQLKIRLEQKMNQLNVSTCGKHQTQQQRQGHSTVALSNANCISKANNTGIATTASSGVSSRLEQEIGRMRRTMRLIISLGMVFCICWTPLNILNIVSHSNIF